MVTDLERFFRRIVTNLAAADARRLREPVPLADIPVSIVPYRTNRRALQVDTSEEYEMVLLRLCAGEGGYVRTDPEQVRQKFEAEARSANPDLEVLHRFEDVSILLRPDRVDRALRPIPRRSSHADLALHSHRLIERHRGDGRGGDGRGGDGRSSDVRGGGRRGESRRSDEPAGSQCVYCGGALPDRPVNFCPHCGQSQVATVCSGCHAEVEPGWRHCVNCGVALRGR